MKTLWRLKSNLSPYQTNFARRKSEHDRTKILQNMIHRKQWRCHRNDPDLSISQLIADIDICKYRPKSDGIPQGKSLSICREFALVEENAWTLYYFVTGFVVQSPILRLSLLHPAFSFDSLRNKCFSDAFSPYRFSRCRTPLISLLTARVSF